jgi:hypothetical protein
MKKYFLQIILLGNILYGYIIIEHTPIKYFVPDYRIKFQAKMKDYYHNFVSAKLKFMATGKMDSFFYVKMVCNPDNFCSATIPAPTNEVKEIVYFIEAKDRIGDIYKTQNYAIPQIPLPAWQVETTKDNINLESDVATAKNVNMKPFKESVDVLYSAGKLEKKKQIESKFIPPKEEQMLSPAKQKIDKNQIKNVTDETVDLTGIWAVRRTLSTCRSGLYSYKVIKIKSLNGVISESSNLNKGTRFLYTDKNGYVCQLIDDNVNNSLVGENAIYTYKSFFTSLKRGLSSKEFVKLLEFGENLIKFELHLKDGKVLTTIYSREKQLSFFK